MPSEADYKSRKNAKGGSPKGRDVRRCPVKLKDLATQLAIKVIGEGNESYFIHNPNAKARFTAKAFASIVPMLWEHLPKECQQYFGGREGNAAYLMSQRFHKQYYIYQNGVKARGKSREHKDYRK